jgi:Photoprotection regulator fluorescence recovery protein
MSNEWSASEKKIAQRVFDAALHRELAEVMQAFKSMAASAAEPGDMWRTEEFLTRSRHAIDRKYDYRYSQLEFVFAHLLREGRVTEEEIQACRKTNSNTLCVLLNHESHELCHDAAQPIVPADRLRRPPNTNI